MKKSVLLLLIICSLGQLSAQKKVEKKIESLKKELSENACKCIDSIDTRNKTKDQITALVHRCINAQTDAYLIGASMMSIDLSGVDKNGTLNITLNTDSDSQEYKQRYYELENYLMEHCKGLKRVMASADIEGDKTISSNQEAREFYQKGQEADKKGKYSKAIEYYKKAVEIDSVFAFAWDNMGICYRRINDYDRAIQAYTISNQLYPKGTTALQNMAVAYSFKKEYDKAISYYNQLAAISKNDPEVFYGIALVYVHKKDFEQALHSLCKAYLMYIEVKSPYRSDAEKLFSMIYTELKSTGNETIFSSILQQYKINIHFEN